MEQSDKKCFRLIYTCLHLFWRKKEIFIAGKVTFNKKKAKEQARREQEIQAAQLQSQQQAQANQHGHRKRVSLKNDLNKKIEVVRKYDEDRQAAIARGEIISKKRDDQNLS